MKSDNKVDSISILANVIAHYILLDYTNINNVDVSKDEFNHFNIAIDIRSTSIDILQLINDVPFIRSVSIDDNILSFFFHRTHYTEFIDILANKIFNYINL